MPTHSKGADGLVMPDRVAVVGAGISGVACALALHHRGVDVVVLDRGRRLGGRMAARTLRDTGLPYDGRVVDVGAAYLTADNPRFGDVVDDWTSRSLLREWTDTFLSRSPDGSTSHVTGPMRYAAPGGLRSLVEDLAADLPVLIHPHEVEDVTRSGAGCVVDAEPFDVVVLAMPGPQARDILAADDPAQVHITDQHWEPVLTVVAAYDEHCWDPFDAMFINDSAVLGFVADDGRRRGDGAPVLVAHSTSLAAARHLDDPSAGAPMMLHALAESLGTTTAPAWSDVRRWSLARPRATEPAPFAFDGVVGLCGDHWGTAPRIETAWLSGDSLGRAIADQLSR